MILVPPTDSNTVATGGNDFRFSSRAWFCGPPLFKKRGPGGRPGPNAPSLGLVLLMFLYLSRMSSAAWAWVLCRGSSSSEKETLDETKPVVLAGVKRLWMKPWNLGGYNELRLTLCCALVGHIVFLLLVLLPEGGYGRCGEPRVVVRIERDVLKDDWPSFNSK